MNSKNEVQDDDSQLAAGAALHSLARDAAILLSRKEICEGKDMWSNYYWPGAEGC